MRDRANADSASVARSRAANPARRRVEKPVRAPMVVSDTLLTSAHNGASGSLLPGDTRLERRAWTFARRSMGGGQAFVPSTGRGSGDAHGRVSAARWRFTAVNAD